MPSPERPVLVVDGSAGSRSSTDFVLRSAGYQTTTASTLTQGLAAVRTSHPVAVVVDLDLPDGCGLDLVSEARWSDTVSIVTTSLVTIPNLVRAFQAGADDFIANPVVPEELTLRLAAALRRVEGRSGGSLSFGDLVIDADGRRVAVRGVDVFLTAREFDLLRFLAERPGRVFTRDQLLASVWHSSGDWQQAATVTEHVRRLRQKIERDPHQPQMLTTARGVGYRFERRREVRADTSGAAA